MRECPFHSQNKYIYIYTNKDGFFFFFPALFLSFFLSFSLTLYFPVKSLNLKEKRLLCGCSCCGAPTLKRLDMKEVWHKQTSKEKFTFLFLASLRMSWGQQNRSFLFQEIYRLITPLSYIASPKTTSAVWKSAVFGAPICSHLSWCAYIAGEEKETPDQYQVLPCPLLFQILPLYFPASRPKQLTGERHKNEAIAFFSPYKKGIRPSSDVRQTKFWPSHSLWESQRL